MGGGSSDAATTLLALNKLWSLALSIDELAQLGVQLGADVPVFVRGQNSFAEGIGEQLQTVVLPKQWFVVVKPPIEVATAVIFAHPQLTRDSQALRIPAFFDPSTIGANTEQLQRDFLSSAALRNDCESVVRREYPEVDTAMQKLAQIGRVRMTGTGSCLFVGFSQRQQAEQAITTLEADTDYPCFLAPSSDRSAAHKVLDA